MKGTENGDLEVLDKVTSFQEFKVNHNALINSDRIENAFDYSLYEIGSRDVRFLHNFYNALRKEAINLKSLESFFNIIPEEIACGIKYIYGSYNTVVILFHRLKRLTLISFQVSKKDISLLRGIYKDTGCLLDSVNFQYTPNDEAWNASKSGKNSILTFSSFYPCKNITMDSISTNFKDKNRSGGYIFYLYNFRIYMRILMAENKLDGLFHTDLIYAAATRITKNCLENRFVWAQLVRTRNKKVEAKFLPYYRTSTWPTDLHVSLRKEFGIPQLEN